MHPKKYVDRFTCAVFVEINYSKDKWVVFGTCMVMNCKKAVFIRNNFGHCFTIFALCKAVTHVS